MLARPLIAVALFALAGCRPDSPLNVPCTLVKGSDGGIVPILEADIKEGANKDFISFGSTECEDFVCVRDANFKRDPDLTHAAMGYCSRSCLPNSECPAHDGADDTNAARKLTCRALLLDADTIAAICVAQPTAPFCGVRSPYFCARSAADAGI